MTTRNNLYSRLLAPALGLLALVATTVATAGNGPDPSGLPRCSAVAYNADGGSCRLPLKNGDFSNYPGGTTDIASWRVEGLPSIGGFDTGNTYAQMFPGSAIRQTVYLDTVTLTQDATYALRFKYRGDSVATPLEVKLSLSDDTSGHTTMLGALNLTAVPGEWRDAELIVEGKVFPAPAHALIEMASTGSQLGASLQIDDVYLVESTDAGTAGR